MYTVRGHRTTGLAMSGGGGGQESGGSRKRDLGILGPILGGMS